MRYPLAVNKTIYQSPFYFVILFALTFEFKDASMHVFVECHLHRSSDTLATNMQNIP